jgi:chromosome segregation ATPase
MDSPRTVTDMSPNNQQRPSELPPVRLEVRHGNSPPLRFDIEEEEFLIGSVPGCDLRLPGSNLPPNICLIKRGPDGVKLRKLAPTQPILVNGNPMPPSGLATLTHADIVTVGPVDIQVAIAFKIPQFLPPPGQGNTAAQPAGEEIARQQLALEARARALEEQAQELEADRVLWYQRRDEIEKEIDSARTEVDRHRRMPATPTEQERDIRARIEREVHEQYRTRHEELDRMQGGLREAALKLREQQLRLEDGLRNADPRLRELAGREQHLAAMQQGIDTRVAEFQRQRETFDADRRLLDERLRQREDDLARRELELTDRDLVVRKLTEEVERDKSQYQADLVRIDRLSVALEAKDVSLKQRAEEVDQRHQQLQRDVHDFEEQLNLFDEREERLKLEEARLTNWTATLDERDTRINERIVQIETQQATLAALRTRLEHIKDELLAQESRLLDERAKLDGDSEEKIAQQRRELLEREQFERDRDDYAESYRLYLERSELMAESVERLRLMQESLDSEEARLQALQVELTQRDAAHAESSTLLEERTTQLHQALERIETDRQALRERDQALLQAEEVREALQEQLRNRAEELAERQRELDARHAHLDEHASTLAARAGELEAREADAVSVRRLTDEEAALIAERDQQLQVAEATIIAQRQELADSQEHFEKERLEAEEQLGKARAEIEELKEALSTRTGEMLTQIPDLEQRAQSALDRTAQAREGLRAQLGELHKYALRSQQDLDAVRSQVQEELNRLREQEGTLSRSRSEHRLAVTSFKQQLIEWQGRFAEMRQSLHQGETRLDRREKLVEATEQHLAKQAEVLQQQEHEVLEKRTEVDGHLTDMRDWFKQKFRQIAHTQWSRHHEPETPEILHLMPAASEPSTSESDPPSAEEVILTMPDDLDPGDRQLGERLQSLDIVDRDTLHTLWEEARRQRRTLRQILLAGGYLTLYQLALIESGNLNALMLGRFRVVDRILSTPREAIYRVFDPQLPQGSNETGGICILRHLGEAEMHDAVRPDEYWQRFGLLRDLAHPNLAATYEILELNGRPAVVQEWLTGLSASDWPPLVGSPGVWHRVMMQIAQGMMAAHDAGLVHGRLSEDTFQVTAEGVVKISGMGEPPWLYAGHTEPTPEEDLRRLGELAFEWAMMWQKRKGAKSKPIPPAMLHILQGLGVSLEEGAAAPVELYSSAGILLEELDRAANLLPSETAAWNKLLEQVNEYTPMRTTLRQSA